MLKMHLTSDTRVRVASKGHTFLAVNNSVALVRDATSAIVDGLVANSRSGRARRPGESGK